jgi:hypothetical protein
MKCLLRARVREPPEGEIGSPVVVPLHIVQNALIGVLSDATARAAVTQMSTQLVTPMSANRSAN